MTTERLPRQVAKVVKTKSLWLKMAMGRAAASGAEAGN
jgi:hypothetical protein